jgi:hypothetical protein
MILPVAGLLAACSSQPLTGNMTGTGGTGTGAGATGGVSNLGTGGTGGAAAACLDLANQYRQALTAAQACDVGAAGDCQQLVTGGLSICGAPPTYVTDSSKLSVLQQLWNQENCLDVLPRVPCPLLLPVNPSSSVCVAADGGTRGSCSDVYGGTGGSTGTGGSIGTGGAPGDGGVSSCNALAEKYAAVLAIQESCSTGAPGQCGQSVPPSLLPCRSACVQFVNDATDLNAIRDLWDQQGCNSNVAVACPAIACAPANGQTCNPTDAGGGRCGAGILLVE